MLESNSDAVKRQANSRNRTNNRRNSRDRVDRPSSSGSETGERAGSSSSSGIAVSERASITNKTTKASDSEISLPGGVEMNECSNIEAVRFLNERWVAALQSQNDPTLNAADRPVVYSSSEGSSAWGSSKLAYQASATDFVMEVGHTIHRSQH